MKESPEKKMGYMKPGEKEKELSPVFHLVAQ